jgi:cytochrome oxidase assembly protein ShyY1
MTTFLMEAVVLCALFHLGVWTQVRQNEWMNDHEA